jgi:uncharacterized lipoprotein YddW (UPF0748 family)
MDTFKKKALWIALEGDFRERISKNPGEGEEQISRIVSDCSEMGFNLILPCIRTHDNTNGYRSDIEKNYYGWDLLDVFCREAKGKGIKIHPWFCFWGDGANRHPELHSADWQGNPITAGENTPTLCPLRPESQEYMLSLVGEIIERYPVDGFNLDYIRYLHAPCYCDYHREKFRLSHGIDPIKLDEDSELWDTWNRFNSEGMTDFVRRVSEKVRDKGREVSADLFQIGRHVIDSPDRPLALSRIVPGDKMGKPHHLSRYWAIFQDWPAWCERGYLDCAITMQYTPHIDMVEESASGGLTAARSSELLMGLGLIWGQTAENLVQQIELCRQKGLAGVCFYDYFHLMDWKAADREQIIRAINK